MNNMNMLKMMKQVKEIQKKMGSDQQNINQQKFVGKSPNNLVTVVLTGDHRMHDMKIAPKALNAKDSAMLSDLTVSAVNDALSQIDKVTRNTLGKYTKRIPGMK